MAAGIRGRLLTVLRKIEAVRKMISGWAQLASKIRFPPNCQPCPTDCLRKRDFWEKPILWLFSIS